MLKEKNDIKALILIVSSHLGKVSSDMLISAVLATELVDMTGVTDCFEELVNDGLLGFENVSGKKSCYVTGKGKSILSELSSFLSAGIAEQAKRSAVLYYEAQVAGTRYYSSIQKSEKGYYLICNFSENGNTVCEVKQWFEDEKSAVLAKRNFEQRQQAVMNAVKAAVTGNVDFMI